MTNAVVRTALSCGRSALLEDEEREDDRSRAARPEPAEEGDGRPPSAGSQHRDRDRDDADDREAEHGVDRDLPAEVADRGPEEHRAEEDEGHGGEHGARLLDEVGDLASAMAAQPAEHDAADERGDEARSADRLREREREERSGERARPGARCRRPAAAPPRGRRRLPRRPRRDASDETPYPIFSKTSWTAWPWPTAPSSACATASAIRKSGTQMPSLRPLSTFRLWRMRTGRRCDVTTTWPSAASVGARMIATRSASGQARSASSDERDGEAGEDRERKPDPEQSRGDVRASAQRREVDPRRVGEEDDREGRLGEGLDLEAFGLRVDEPERVDAHDQAGGREEHRRREAAFPRCVSRSRRSRGGRPRA